jgi:hypothetical protein
MINHTSLYYQAQTGLRVPEIVLNSCLPQPSSLTMASINLLVSFRGIVHSLSVDTTTTLADFQSRVEALTEVPPALQKLLYKGKKTHTNADKTSILDIGMKNGTRITLVGSTEGEIEGMRATEAESQRKENIMRQRQSRGPSKVRYPNRALYVLSHQVSGGVNLKANYGRSQIPIPSRRTTPSPSQTRDCKATAG